MITVLIPCLNEVEGIPRWKEDLFPSLKALDEPWEVLAVDDGSTDGTGAALAALCALQPGVRVLTHPGNLGLGAALRSGLREANGEWLVCMDADLTFHPRWIAALLDARGRSGADCVSGSPFLAGMPGVPLGRQLPSRMLNAFYRGFLRRELTSFTPLFRLYRTADLRALGLRCDGFEVSVEILAGLLRAGRAVVEVPVPLTERETGASKLRRWRELKNHLRLIRRLLGQ